MSEEQFKWYAINIASGSEKRVKQLLLENAAKHNLIQMFADIIIPSVEVDALKRGKEVKVSKKIMPGYIFVKMIMNEESWQLVKSIPQVSKFLGSSSKASEISEAEINKVLEQINFWKEDQSTKGHAVGDVVEIIDGPFESLSGTITSVNAEQSKLEVSVYILGRSAPVSVSFSQVKKKNSGL